MPLKNKNKHWDATGTSWCLIIPGYEATTSELAATRVLKCGIQQVMRSTLAKLGLFCLFGRGGWAEHDMATIKDLGGCSCMF